MIMEPPSHDVGQHPLKKTPRTMRPTVGVIRTAKKNDLIVGQQMHIVVSKVSLPHVDIQKCTMNRDPRNDYVSTQRSIHPGRTRANKNEFSAQKDVELAVTVPVHSRRTCDAANIDGQKRQAVKLSSLGQKATDD